MKRYIYFITYSALEFIIYTGCPYSFYQAYLSGNAQTFEVTKRWIFFQILTRKLFCFIQDQIQNSKQECILNFLWKLLYKFLMERAEQHTYLLNGLNERESHWLESRPSKNVHSFFLYDFYWLNSIHYLKYCIHNIPVSIYFYLLLILSVFIHTIFDSLSSFFC